MAINFDAMMAEMTDSDSVDSYREVWRTRVLEYLTGRVMSDTDINDFLSEWNAKGVVELTFQEIDDVTTNP